MNVVLYYIVGIVMCVIGFFLGVFLPKLGILIVVVYYAGQYDKLDDLNKMFIVTLAIGLLIRDYIDSYDTFKEQKDEFGD